MVFIMPSLISDPLKLWTNESYVLKKLFVAILHESSNPLAEQAVNTTLT